MELDYLNQELRINNKKIHLTNTELKILTALYNSKNTTVTREQFSELLNHDISSNLTDVYVHLIRGKTKGILNIDTVRGNGYRLKF